MAIAGLMALMNTGAMNPFSDGKSDVKPDESQGEQRQSGAVVSPGSSFDQMFQERFKSSAPEPAPAPSEKPTPGPTTSQGQEGREERTEAPRNVRNNNPGNIRHGDDWIGMADEQQDDEFITFDSPEFGVRAAGRVLQTYRTKHNLNTVKGIINRWAPPNENDTENYINNVVEWTGFSPDQKIDTSNPDTLESLLRAIFRMEGEVPEDRAIKRGVQLAIPEA